MAVDLPNGRSIVLPVSEATRGAHVVAYVAPMLGCDAIDMRLWRADGNTMLQKDDQAMPGHRYHAKLLAKGGRCHVGWAPMLLHQLDAPERLRGGPHGERSCAWACVPCPSLRWLLVAAITVPPQTYHAH